MLVELVLNFIAFYSTVCLGTSKQNLLAKREQECDDDKEVKIYASHGQNKSLYTVHTILM